MLFKAIVLPLFDYCDTLYGTAGNCYLNRLQRLQNRGGKTILKLPRETSTKFVLDSLKWFPLKDRISLHNCVLVYKCLHNLAPENLQNRFQFVSNPYSTRSQARKDLTFPIPKLSLQRKSFVYQGAMEWNKLPQTCKEATTIGNFKHRCVQYFLHKNE